MAPAEDRRVIASCSFCLKPSTDVGTLVAGPGVFICDECVALCAELIKGKPPGPRPQLAPWEHPVDLEGALSNLPLVVAAGAQVDAALAGWVRRCRSLGATWERIGDALGMSRQSAWERFAAED